jgi:outer membrane autotransporter protein
MISRIGAEYLAGIGPKRLACSVKAKSPALGAGALVVMLFSSSAAEAQCVAVGLNPPPPNFPTQVAVAAIAGVSASVGSLVSSVNSANTVFLTQSNAFIGAPANPQPDQEGGGVWARGVGGHLAFGTTATAGNISFDGPVPGSVTCNTRTLLDFAGVQIGADVARLNVNGWNVHAGSTIGYLGSKTQDATPSGLNPPASFRDSLQIPFVGLYVAASKGGFFVDGQLRGNFFQNEVSDNNHGMSGQRFDARGISLTANVGYNKNLGNNWFIEPSAGIVWSRTHVDPLNVPGTLVVGHGGVPPWVLAIDDIQSTLGRLSVRVGTSVAFGNVVLQPFASASILHEFQGGVASSLTSDFAAIGAPLPTLSSTVSTGSLGTYGQFGLGAAAQVVNTGWLSYLRADYRTGDNIEGWSVNGGLRYQFVPDPRAGGRGPAIAKVPVYKAPAQALYDWTGFYIGGHLGADWGFTSWNIIGAGATNPRFAGFLGGGEIGYNHQAGRWVFGVEGDLSWTNARGARPCSNGFFYNCEIDVNWLSTMTARIGYAYWDRLLVYAKGGAAIAQDRAQFACSTNSQPTIVPLVGCPSQSDSKTKAGWTVGWGSEFGLTQNVSVKGEIMYFNLGTDRYDMAGILADVQRDGFISTVGLHLRFGGQPTPAALVAKN